MGRHDDRIRDQLPKTTLFRGLPPGRLDDLVAGATWRRWTAGAVVWAEGAAPDAMLLILSGSLDVARRTLRGRRVLRTLYPPDLVGISCVAGAPHSADLVAGPDLEGAVLPGPAVRALFRREPDVALRALAQLGTLVARLSMEKEEVAQDDLDTRVRRWVEARAAHGTEIVCTHDQIAEHLGATRPRVSQALQRLEETGRIRRMRGRLRWLAAPPAPPSAT